MKTNPYSNDEHNDQQLQHDAWEEGYVSGRVDSQEIVDLLVKALEYQKVMVGIAQAI